MSEIRRILHQEDITSDATQLAVLWTEMGFLISSYYDVTLAFAKLLSTTGMKGGVTSPYIIPAPEDYSQSEGKC